MLLPGKVIDHYTIIGEIASGGMGTVYKALDGRLQRVVAIKVIKSENVEDRSFRRFQREIQICANLSHPGIVHVYHLGLADKMPYLSMEYIDGSPLIQYFAENKFSLNEKLAFIEKVARAVHYAHSKGIIHRDIKPQNIMVRRENNDPVLLDFGIARAKDLGISITRSGEVVGTVQYMSPEQAEGRKKNIDHRTDVYALGAVLYHVITGQPPVANQGFMEMIYELAVKQLKPPRAICPEIPRRVENICLKAMAKNRSQRYPTAAAFAADLRKYLQNQKITAAHFRLKQKVIRAAKLIALALIVAMLGLEVYWKWPAGELEPCLDNVKRLYWQGSQEKYPENAYCLFSQAKISLKKLKNVGKNERKEWQEKITLAILEALSRLQRYQDICQSCNQPDFILPDKNKADRISWQRNLSIVWFRAQATYHCKKTETAQNIFQQIIDTTPDHWKEHIGSLYYRGRIYFDQGKLQKAKEDWQEAQNKLTKANIVFSLRNKLYLYLCVAILAGKHPDKELLRAYFPKIEKPNVPGIVYYETCARYWLLQLEEKGKNISTQAADAIDNMNKCLQQDPSNADYYRLRSQAYQYCEKYDLATRDVAIASTLQPSRLDFLAARLDLIGLYAPPEEFHNYYRQLRSQLAEMSSIKPDLFAEEFRQVRLVFNRHYSLPTIPFSEEKFIRSYRKLFSNFPKTRELAADIISMFPYQKVLSLLQSESAKATAKQRQNLDQLIKRIKKQENRRLCNECIQRLSGICPRGAIPDSVLSAFGKQVVFLKEILQDHKADLSPADDEAKVFWPQLRFLAARVLANLPYASIRSYLYAQMETPAPDIHISTRIFTARVLVEIGFNFKDSHFNKHLLRENLPTENEFLNVLLTNIIPLNNQDRDLLLKIFYRKKTNIRDKKRDAFAAASRLKGCFGGLPGEKQLEIFQLIRDGNRHVDPQIRAFSIMAFWDVPFYQAYWKTRIAKNKEFDLLMKALQCKYPMVQYAALSAVRYFTYFDFIDKEVFRIFEATKKIVADKSILDLVYYQAINVLMFIGNSKPEKAGNLLKAIAFDYKKNWVRRLPAILGLANLPTTQIALIPKLQNLVEKDHDLRIRAITLYALARHLAAIKDQQIVRNLSSFVGSLLLKALQSPAQPLQLHALAAMPYIESPSPEIIKKIEKIWRCDPHLQTKAMALSALINLQARFPNQSLVKREEWQNWVKTQTKKQQRQYRFAAAWGYSDVVKNDIECPVHLAKKVNWNADAIRHYEMTKMTRLAVSQKKHNLYIQNLSAVLKILQEMEPDEKQYRLAKKHLSLLIQLYIAFGKKDLAIGELRKFRSYFSDRIDFSILYADILEGGQALAELPQFDQQTITSRQYAKILRIQARVDQQRNNLPAALEKLRLQHCLMPGDPEALMALAKYYYSQGNCQAERYLDRLDKKFIQNGEACFLIAKIAAARGEQPKAILFLSKAVKQDYLLDTKQITTCSHLAKLPFAATAYQIACACMASPQDKMKALKWLEIALQGNHPVTAKKLRLDFKGIHRSQMFKMILRRVHRRSFKRK